MSTNPPKIKITQQEINDIYEITKQEPYPKVEETQPGASSSGEQSTHPPSIRPQELEKQTDEQREKQFDDDIGAYSEEEYNKNEEAEPEIEI